VVADVEDEWGNTTRGRFPASTDSPVGRRGWEPAAGEGGREAALLARDQGLQDRPVGDQLGDAVRVGLPQNHFRARERLHARFRPGRGRRVCKRRGRRSRLSGRLSGVWTAAQAGIADAEGRVLQRRARRRRGFSAARDRRVTTPVWLTLRSSAPGTGGQRPGCVGGGACGSRGRFASWRLEMRACGGAPWVKKKKGLGGSRTGGEARRGPESRIPHPESRTPNPEP
jgi:hypothetical protein